MNTVVIGVQLHRVLKARSCDSHLIGKEHCLTPAVFNSSVQPIINKINV